MTDDNNLVKRLREPWDGGFSRRMAEEFEAANRIEELEAEKDWYRDLIVWGFYEDGEPKYYQGKAGEHEICDPVTAKEVTCLLSKLNNAEAALEEMRELFFERMGAQKSHPLAWEYYTGEKKWRQAMTKDNDLVRRLREPAFGTETTERNLMGSAADRIETLTEQLEDARLDAKEAEAYSVWLESKLQKTVTALQKVRDFVRDLEPYADQGHTLAPALHDACVILNELEGDWT